MEDEGNISSQVKGVLTIIIIIVVCLVGYFVYDSFLKPVKSVSTNSTIVTDAMKLVKSSNYLRGSMEVMNSFYTDSIVTNSTLSDKDKSWTTYSHITDNTSKLVLTCSALKGYDDDLYKTCNSYGTAIAGVTAVQKLTYDNFKTEYQTIFGSDTTAPTSGFSEIGLKGYYSEENNDFLIVSFSGVGGFDNKFSLTSLKDATIYPDRLEIEQYYALCSIDPGLKCVAGTKTIKEDATITDKDGLDVSQFGALYKFTFNKNTDGSYYWYSTEPVEK